MFKSVIRQGWVVECLGALVAGYLRFVRRTSQFRYDHPDAVDEIVRDMPFIVALWHGQGLMLPFIRPQNVGINLIISRSIDGEIMVAAFRRFGMGAIRASGSQQSHKIAKRGGAHGFRAALRSLAEGRSVALTADIPRGPARKSGKGIIQIARHSGRPIFPVAIASNRRWVLNSWDKASINLPFSKLNLCVGAPIYVDKTDGAEYLQEMQERLDTSLNEITARAYASISKS